MQKIKLFPFGIIVIFSTALLSCTSINRLSNINPINEMIPADFTPGKQVLLVAEFPQKNNPNKRHVGYTNKMENILNKYYPFKFEIVSRNEILDKNSKYSDTSIYKYAIVNFMVQNYHTSKTTVRSTDLDGRERKTTVAPTIVETLNDFHFYDRSLGKNFPGSGIGSSNLSDKFKAFIKTINKAKGL